MPKLISAKLEGGLGNQLFEIAHALTKGLKYNRKVCFLASSDTPGQGNDASKYVNNIFRKVRFFGFLDRLKLICGLYQFKTITEQAENLSPYEGNTIYEGFFQSKKYWCEYEKEIRDYFLPTENFKKNKFKKYPQLLNANTLSLHIRRTDYLNSPRFHPVVSVEYIKKALEEMGSYSTIFVFSDDHNWVKANLNLPNAIYVNEDEDYKELWLMSLCKNHIISNSTFSWWGSFLNPNINKKTIAPSVWFGPDGPDGKDIYESYWKLIDVEWKNGSLVLKK